MMRTRNTNKLKVEGFQEVLQVHHMKIQHIYLMLQTTSNMHGMQYHPLSLSMHSRKQKILETLKKKNKMKIKNNK